MSSTTPLPESPNFTAELKPQKKLSLILHHSPLAMVEWDSERVIVGWNSAAAELFSFFEDEAVGQNIDQLLCQRQVANLEPGDWTRCDRAGFLREHTGLSGTKHCRWFNTPFVVRGKQVGTLSTIVEVTHQTALSGEEMRAQLHSRTQVLKHTTARLQAIMRDRAQLQAALQASEERFAQLSTHQTSADIAEQTIESESERHAERQEHTPVFFESLINGITSPLFVKDAEHRLVLANDAFLAFVGRSREEVLGKASSDFMPSEKAKAIRQQDEHVLNSGRTHIAEDYFADSQASNKFVMTTKTRFYGAESAPYLLGSLRDLTEQVIAQKASLESEKRLKKLAANVPGMLYQFKLEPDLTSSFVYVSSNSEALLGLSPSQVKADCDAVLSLIHPDDKASFDRSVALSAQTLSDWRWQGRFLVSEDRIVWLQGASRPERLPDNSVLWDGLFIDISDVKQVEAELQTSEVRLR
ncbi:MAG: PAS domain S-box protein [Cyanobacteria bacterium J06632_3]